MKLTDRAKKRLIAAGLGAVCIILIISIASQFKTEAPKDASVQSPTRAADPVSPSNSTLTEPQTQATEVSTKPIDPTVTPTQPKDTGDATGTEQRIQAEVTKPPEPSQKAKTDPKKTPDGEKVTPTEHDKITKPESKPSSAAPKSGDKKDGKIYVPGFGWVEDNGGGSSGKTANDMYENGNKIGKMD